MDFIKSMYLSFPKVKHRSRIWFIGNYKVLYCSVLGGSML